MVLRCAWLWLLLILLSFEGSPTHGCLEDERSALLQLRKFLYDPSSLIDWVEGNSDCCQWEGVSCNDTTGRVDWLDLAGTRNRNQGEWNLNVSLFSSFQDLNGLYLSDNLIAGCVENEGFERLSNLTNLEELYLSRNMFSDGRIFSSLSQLSSLKYLNLGYNQLKELNHFNGSNLNKLESLYLSGNIFDNNTLSSLATLPSLKGLNIGYIGLKEAYDVQGLEWLSRLRDLEYLDLSGNNINNNTILSYLSYLPSLKQLYLSEIGLKGMVEVPGNQGLRNLQQLILSNISGDATPLLRSVGSLPSIEWLDLTYNNFTGTVTTEELQNLTNIIDLALDYSSLHISLLQNVIGAVTSLESLSIQDSILNNDVLPIQDLTNFKNLKELDMTGTAIHENVLRIITRFTYLERLHLSSSGLQSTLSNQGLCELVHLKYFDLSNNDLRGTLPDCLANLTSLQWLDISFNHFIGSISSSPLKFLTSIEDLSISNNHFQIPITLIPFVNHSKLKYFDGTNNEIHAENKPHSLVPKFQLNYITLSNCRNIGPFPKFLYYQHDLEEVDLSGMNLKGEFPIWLLENNRKLEKLNLVNNSLSGPFLLPIHSHKHLTILDISINSLSNHIPRDIGAYLPELKYLNISKNFFSGDIPSSFGEMKVLEILDLSHNLLSGEIPEGLAMGCLSLRILVLSNNSLQGKIFPTNFNLKNLVWLQLDGNNFSGRMPDSLSNCSLLGLYLNNNNLSGEIPRWLGNMSYLKEIRISNNHLEGPIPLEFCQLEKLLVLDLSQNNLIGSLPSCFCPSSIIQVHLSRNKLQGQLKGAFSNSSSLMTLDIGYNHFNGSIQKWIGRLSNLTYLILSYNHFEGEVPSELCQLGHLQLIDLSHNSFYGHIPPCLNINAVSYSTTLPTISMRGQVSYVIGNKEIIEFTTKKISYFYQGRILNNMSGIDLSCNKLVGEIPNQIGNLVEIHTLNLSYNNLIGLIPSTFSNLKQIESLDLSHNNLNGIIPPQLVELNYLSIFSVAYNNLSGKVPDRTAQFATFEKDSYEGNRFLCGEPLPKCNINDSSSTIPRTSREGGEDSNFMDMDMFYISFSVTFIIVLLGIIIIFYINPYWHHSWFSFIKLWMMSSYYFVVDRLLK